MRSHAIERTDQENVMISLGLSEDVMIVQHDCHGQFSIIFAVDIKVRYLWSILTLTIDINSSYLPISALLMELGACNALQCI